MVSNNYSYLIIIIHYLHKVICFQVLLYNNNNLYIVIYGFKYFKQLYGFKYSYVIIIIYT